MYNRKAKKEKGKIKSLSVMDKRSIAGKVVKIQEVLRSIGARGTRELARNVNRDVKVEEAFLVSDLPPGWKRLVTGKGSELVTAGGLRLTSQIGVDLYTSLHHMPRIRLDWEELMVMPKGVRFESSDSEAVDDLEGFLERVDGGKKSDLCFSGDEDLCRDMVLEGVVEKGMKNRFSEEKTSLRGLVLEELVIKTTRGQRVNKKETRYEKHRGDSETVLNAPKDGKTLDGINGDVKDLKEILEIVEDQYGLEEGSYVENKEADCVILERAEDANIILEAVEDDVNNCNILEAVEEVEGGILSSSDESVVSMIDSSSSDSSGFSEAMRGSDSQESLASSSPLNVASSSPLKVATSSPLKVATSSPLKVASPSPQQVASPSPLQLYGGANSQTSSLDQSLASSRSGKGSTPSLIEEKSPVYEEESPVHEEESLPPGWLRKSRARAKGGKTDWSVVSPAGQTFRSQKQLDAFTGREGLNRLALKPQLLKQAAKKRPAEQEERVEEDDGENTNIEKVKLYGDRKIGKRRRHLKNREDGNKLHELLLGDETRKKVGEKVVSERDVEGGAASGEKTSLESIEKSTKKYKSKTSEKPASKSSGKLVGKCIVETGEQSSENSSNETSDTPVKRSQSGRLLRPSPRMLDIMAGFTVLCRAGGGEGGDRKRRIAEEIMEELEAVAVATVAVSFVSDDGELEERVEELGRSRSASRVRRNRLLVEDRMGRRTGRVTRIKEPMYWLKPSKTEDNYGLGSRREIEGDSEAKPKKILPAWAENDQVFPAMEQQSSLSPSLIFGECGNPDLALMFGLGYRRDREGSSSSP